jgi:two-component system cell cycle response regulator
MTRDRVANPLEDTTRMAPPDKQGDEGVGAPPAAAYLVVLAGSNVGEMYKLETDRVVIGRSDRASLRFIDDGISREHVAILKSAGQFVIEDLGSTNGTYCNGQRIQRHALAEGDKILLGSATILKFSYQDRLDEAFQRQMSESALRDGLTRAYNKRYFGERLESELQYALRHTTPLALVFMDIDHFKRINDTHGHQAGDHVLMQLATLMLSALGEDQLLARYGGEEFAIVARGAGRGEAMILSERLRAAVEAQPFVYDGARIPVTVSVGVASVPGAGVASAADLVSRADDALSRATRGGRNRVVFAD